MTYDVIVLGAGGVGSAAAHQLAKRGLRVLALEQFSPAHNQGSSHGETRIIRKAYFEHPNYVPLLERAYKLWGESEAEHQKQLHWQTGLVEVSPPGGVIVPAVLEAARQHDLAVDTLTAADFAERFPALTLPAGHQAVFEPEAGFLRVEDCVQAHVDLAEKHGATLKFETPVLDWSATESGVEVRTPNETFSAASLAIAAGAWSASLTAQLGMPLRILEKHLHWFDADAQTTLDADFPCFFYETSPGAYFYGFPKLPGSSLKVAEHSGGTEIAEPSQATREIDPAEQARVENFLQKHIAGVGPLKRHATCFYSLSPDEHFIIDRHPEHKNVSFVAGLSGHGFKFAPLLGEALADLATGTTLSPEFDFLRIR